MRDDSHLPQALRGLRLPLVGQATERQLAQGYECCGKDQRAKYQQDDVARQVVAELALGVLRRRGRREVDAP